MAVPTPDQLLEGVTGRSVSSDRLDAYVLETGAGSAGTPVVFVHGNVSSSLFWQPTMLALRGRHCLAVDLRGFGGSPALPVDATRGVRDFSDDVLAVLDALEIQRAVLVGWSMGGGVVLQAVLDRPGLAEAVALVSPISPYGFGGTFPDGTLVTPDGAGTGGGGGNPDFVARLEAGDAGEESPTSPRSVFRSAYVAPGYASEHEDLWVASMLSTATGVDSYPGDSVPSASWPGFAAGGRGVLNTMAPTVFDVTGIVDLAEKPPILWARGEDDAIVADGSFFDLSMLGQAGVIPDWPGAGAAPPQQMVTQTRAVLDAYAAAGGSYAELALPDTGHSAHLERPEQFESALRALLG